MMLRIWTELEPRGVRVNLTALARPAPPSAHSASLRSFPPLGYRLPDDVEYPEVRGSLTGAT